MLRKLISHKIGTALRNEKRKDYMNVVQMQLALIFCALTLQGFAEVFNIPYGATIADLPVLALGSAYMFMLWDMLRNFTRRYWQLVAVLVSLTLAFSTTLVFANPLWDPLPEYNPQWPLFWVHVCLFFTECTVIYYAIYDIFSEETDPRNKIWGSACIYLMIGISFGSLYDLINIAGPGSLGETFEPGVKGYIRCIRLSMNVLANTNSEFPNASQLINNIGIIQSVWSNLYIVLVVGRLLSR
ncbi:MAG: hypothetical protein V4543_17755 [Bacteroidota bacterium]